MTIQVKAQVEAQRWVISAAMPAWVPGILRITQSKCNVSVIQVARTAATHAGEYASC
jgi:hypothetical protein